MKQHHSPRTQFAIIYRPPHVYLYPLKPKFFRYSAGGTPHGPHLSIYLLKDIILLEDDSVLKNVLLMGNFNQSYVLNFSFPLETKPFQSLRLHMHI